jgi:hypothetical protein
MYVLVQVIALVLPSMVHVVVITTISAQTVKSNYNVMERIIVMEVYVQVVDHASTHIVMEQVHVYATRTNMVHNVRILSNVMELMLLIIPMYVVVKDLVSLVHKILDIAHVHYYIQV